MGVVEDRFGENVRAQRVIRHWTQADLAGRLAACGIVLHPSAIAKIEQRDVERPRAIRLNEAVAIAEAFRVPLSELMS